MKKLIFAIRENWEDPVWSKVIAATIITLAGFVLTTLYSLFVSLYYSASFLEIIKGVGDNLNRSIELKVWLILSFILIYLILIISPILKFVQDIFQKINRVNDITDEDSKSVQLRAPSHSTPFFHDRMSSAFPGIREITWFENPKEATERLLLLLREPIKFDPVYGEFESRPIWWFRGGSALYIEKFKKMGRRKVLMNFDQLKIKRIAAYHSASYYKDFVYVEVKGENQTGLYNLDEDDIKRHIDDFGI